MTQQQNKTDEQRKDKLFWVFQNKTILITDFIYLCFEKARIGYTKKDCEGCKYACKNCRKALCKEIDKEIKLNEPKVDMFDEGYEEGLEKAKEILNGRNNKS